MFAPLFELCSGDSDVQTNLGTSPCRIYPFGEAPKDVTKPYAVWQTTGGAPENYLGQTPDMDLYIIQIDIYSEEASETYDAAQALRNVIEQHAHMVGFGGEGRESDTNLYRFRMSINWFVDRDTVS